MDNNKKLFEGLLKADGINPAGATESERIAFGKMLDEQSKSKQSKPGSRPDIWRIIMKSRITQCGAAAVIIIGIGLGLNFFEISPDGASIAWAQVARQLERAQAYSHRAIIKIEGKPKMESHITFSSEHGLKMETKIETITDGATAFTMYANPREEYTIIPMVEQPDCSVLWFLADLCPPSRSRQDTGHSVRGQSMACCCRLVIQPASPSNNNFIWLSIMARVLAAQSCSWQSESSVS